MPHRLYLEGDLLRLDLSGRVGEESFKGFAAELQTLEAGLKVIPGRLTDLSTVTSMDVRFDDMATLAELRKAKRFPNAFKSAIVAPQPMHYGFARMFQTLNDHPQITIRIFADRAKALRWLRGEGDEID